MKIYYSNQEDEYKEACNLDLVRKPGKGIILFIDYGVTQEMEKVLEEAHESGIPTDFRKVGRI